MPTTPASILAIDSWYLRFAFLTTLTLSPKAQIVPPHGATELPVSGELQRDTHRERANGRTGENLVSLRKPTVGKGTKDRNGGDDRATVGETSASSPEVHRAPGVRRGGVSAHRGSIGSPQCAGDVDWPEEVQGGHDRSARALFDRETVPPRRYGECAAVIAAGGIVRCTSGRRRRCDTLRHESRWQRP